MQREKIKLALKKISSPKSINVARLHLHFKTFFILKNIKDHTQKLTALSITLSTFINLGIH